MVGVGGLATDGAKHGVASGYFRQPESCSDGRRVHMGEGRDVALSAFSNPVARREALDGCVRIWPFGEMAPRSERRRAARRPQALRFGVDCPDRGGRTAVVGQTDRLSAA